MSFPDIASRLHQIAPFHVMEVVKIAASLEAQGRDMIHLSIGEPDFTAPPAVVEAAHRALIDGNMRYTSANGLPGLRAAISEHYLRVYDTVVDPSRIIVTAGASAALLLACAALVERDSEVLMPDPSYPCNRHFVAAFDGRATLIASGPDTRFQLTGEMVRKHWSTSTRGVLLASPSNPTGTSIKPDALADIVESVRALGGFTLVDEIYHGLSYEGAPFTAASLGDDVVIINSFSKYFNMTGWRLGWLVVPPHLAPEIEKLAQNLFICPSAVSQHAALACFDPQSLAVYETRKAAFKRRRDYIVPALIDLGFGVPVTPDGAFYVYADCSGLLKDASEDADSLALDIMHKTGVVIVPGRDFGPATALTHVRISYATSMENLKEAVHRLKLFFAAR